MNCWKVGLFEFLCVAVLRFRQLAFDDRCDLASFVGEQLTHQRPDFTRRYRRPEQCDELLDVIQESCASWIAFVAMPSQRLHGDLCEAWVDVAVDCGRIGNVPCDDAMDDLAVDHASPQAVSCCDLPEDCPHCVDVDSSVSHLAEELFGGHVGDLSFDHAGLGFR